MSCSAKSSRLWERDSQYHRGLHWLKTTGLQSQTRLSDCERNWKTKWDTIYECIHTHKWRWKDLEDHKSDWKQVLSMSKEKRILGKSLPCHSHHGLRHDYLPPTSRGSKLWPEGQIWLATCCINKVLTLKNLKYLLSGSWQKSAGPDSDYYNCLFISTLHLSSLVSIQQPEGSC